MSKKPASKPAPKPAEKPAVKRDVESHAYNWRSRNNLKRGKE
jgi:hypothetical protein